MQAKKGKAKSAAATARADGPAEDFFAAPVHDGAAALALAETIVAQARELPAGVHLLVAASPLALRVAELPAAALTGLIARDRLTLAAGVAALMHRLAGEVNPGDYLLDDLSDEIARQPAFISAADAQLAALQALRDKGFSIGGLPADGDAARATLLQISREARISLEFLLGNLNKAATLLKRLGVRNETLNASALFHNYMSGFLDIDAGKARPIDTAELSRRAAELARQGTRLKVFRKGDFNKLVSDLDAAEVDALVQDTSDAYGVSEEAFRGFIDALLGREEARLRAVPDITLTALLQAFRFPESERETVSQAALVRADDPTRWQETPLGRALMALRQNLGWLAVSAGMKAAGDVDAARKNSAMQAAAEALRGRARALAVSLYSGRDGVRRENRLGELTTDELLFDLYCLAVLNKQPLGAVIESADAALAFIQSLENPEPLVNLDTLVAARLAGESYASLLASQGLALLNSALAEAQAGLKALSQKVKFTLNTGSGEAIPLERAGLDDFRKAMVLIGRSLRPQHSPERALALIRDKIVPEIKMLPAAVIAGGTHDLARIVELAACGVPARYPLRRPWKRINLDPLAYMGSGLEPGIRNCLGCPVNSLYGLVSKTAHATGFEEIITYEATGCFEVYSGIWPYTGKKHPTLHGVFGGAPSELLGGYAAKKARLRHARKINGAEGAAYRANLKRTLHLGWGGDGATFDIGFGNLSGLFSRMQKLAQDPLDEELNQRALYVCYDNEGYQNTGNQYSAASAPGGHTTTNPQGAEKPMGNELRKKHIVEIMAEHGASISARMNIHRQEHITRVVNRALEDGVDGAFLHFLQPCTTGWKFTADSLTYDLAWLSEEGGLFSPVTFEHGVPYLEIYPTPRNPGDSFLKLQARFKHLLGTGAADRKNLQRVIDYYAQEWLRNLHLCGFEGEIAYADRLGYLEEEHRMPRVKV